MIKRLLILIAILSATQGNAQTFQVFKGDTINRRDKAGLQQGTWRRYFKNDTLASEMHFWNGKHDGAFKTFSETGKLQSEVNFRKGYMEIGDAQMFYEDGTVKAKGKYINKLKDSTWTYFDEKGKLTSTEFYIKGKKEGISKVFYPDGKVSEETIFKNGLKNGPHKEYFPDGTMKLAATNKNGEYEGAVSIMYPGGKVWMMGRYVGGLREGKWTINKEDGTLDREEIYKKGKITNPVFEKEEKIEDPQLKEPGGN